MTRLRAARENKGWTQGYVAKRTGVSQSVVSDAERGKHAPRAEYVARLYKCVGLDLDDLLYDVEATRIRRGTVRPKTPAK